MTAFWCHSPRRIATGRIVKGMTLLSKRKSTPTTIPAIDKIMAMITVDDLTGCWTYTGYKNAAGYGMYSLRENKTKRQVLVHRYIYEHHFGPIPDGMFVLHGCDNRACCNPDHLRIGTPAENSADAMRRSRIPKGTECNLSVLTPEEVIDIRSQYDAGEPIMAIARAFGVSRWAIYQIGRRATWKHLPESPDHNGPRITSTRSEASARS